jgi:hypothetical protein
MEKGKKETASLEEKGVTMLKVNKMTSTNLRGTRWYGKRKKASKYRSKKGEL